MSDKIFRIEEAQIPKSNFSLPSNIDLKKVVDRVTQSQKSPKLWKQFLSNENSKQVISCFFWYTLVTLVHPNQETQNFLKAKISHHYLDLFSSTSHKQKSVFFPKFHNVLGQTIYYCLFLAFPKSRARLTQDEFKRKFYETVCNEFLGVPQSSGQYQQWELDMGAGNLLAGKPSYSQTTLQKKDFSVVELNVSPVLERYLKSTKRTSNLKSRRMKLSIKDYQKQELKDSKFKDYRRTADEVLRNTRSRFRQFENYEKDSQKNILEKKRSTARLGRFLEERVGQITKNNPNEYGNYIATLGGVFSEL